ncbi:cytosine permease [Thermogemmatispora aurantia]|uniref:purine-cytosine permease family protein n=1 Tax=Thermogemmatispora TaxID=768669 RepID=UPI0008535630|nr:MULTISPECIES: cytosine permease [Thermogemmatispora]GER84383.1 cytosine permease [Thermogemmatispora aurantia]
MEPAMEPQESGSGILQVRGVEADDFLKVERHGMEPIPEADRHGSARELALVWTGAMANYLSLLTGALAIGAPLVLGLSQGQLGLLDSAIAIVIGCALAAALHGLTSATGARTGTPQMVFARAVFGHRGAYLGAFLTWLMAVGWFAVDCVIGGWALVQLASLVGLPRTPQTALIAIALVLIASVIVAVYGHQTVHVFEKYGAIVFMAFCLLLFIVLFPRINWSLPTTVHGPARLAAIVTGGGFIYALIASWIPFASDYSRYLPTRTRAGSIAWWAGLGIGLPTALLGILGVALATINPANPDLLSVITGAAPPWLLVPFLLFVVLGEIWANYFDVYTAGLVALAMDIPLRRWWSAFLCGLVGAVGVGWIGFFSRFSFSEAQTYSELVNRFLNVYIDFLLLTYLWVPAWAAVLLIDFFVLRRGRYAAAELTRGRAGRYWYRGGVAWRAVLSWLVGFAITIPFIGSATLPWLSQPWQGPLAHLLGGMDLSGIIGAVVSGLLYLLLNLPRLRQRPAASAAEMAAAS